MNGWGRDICGRKGVDEDVVVGGGGGKERGIVLRGQLSKGEMKEGSCPG